MTIDTPNADTQGGNTQETPTWWIDEGKPGVGEKPAWLSEKFKSAGDMAKSYQELENRVGKAPEQYDFSKSKFLDGDYVPFQELQEFAKSKRVPQEVMDKMIDSVDKYMSEFSTDYKEEALKLGDNAKERLSTLNNWAKANLTEKSFEALTSKLTNADSVLALEELRGKMMSNNVTIPNGNDAGTNNVTSMEDLQMELNNNLEKFKTDMKYRREIQSKMEAAAKSSTYVDKNW